MTTENIPKLLRKYVTQELPTDNREWEILMFDTADEIERLQKYEVAYTEIMNANRSPESYRTVAQEPELEDGHTDGYSVSGNNRNLDVLGLLRKYENMDKLKKQAADEIERLRECLQHAIDHVGKWQLFTAEEKQRILAEYEQAVRGG